MKRVTIIFFIILGSLSNYSIGQTTFIRSYKFLFCDQEGYQVSEIDSNQYLFLNFINCNMYGESVDLVKVNQYGDTLITSTFGYGHYTSASCFIQTGNSFVIPFTSTTSNNDGITTILKIDSALHEVWHKTFSIAGVDISCGSVIQTSDGGYILGGYSNLNLGSFEDLFILKLNSNGDSLWSKIVNFNCSVYIHSIIEEADNSLIFAGNLLSPGFKGVLIYKTDSIGDSLISKIYNNFNEALFMSKWRNEYVLGGETQNPLSASWNGFMLFLDSNLDSTSSYIYDTGLNEGLYSGTQYSNEFIVTGTILDSTFHSGNLFILNFDTNNVLISNKIINGVYISIPYSTISKTSDGGLILGSTSTDSFGYHTALLIKTDMNGDFVGVPEIRDATEEIISPNPSSEIFYINVNNRVRKGVIYSILGEKIREFSGNEIDLSEYEEGIYFYKITFYTGLVQKGKLIKVN